MMSPHNYLIVVYISVPVLLLLLVATLFYVCCSRQYRLNWYEQTLLDSSRAGEKEHIAQRDAPLTLVYAEQDVCKTPGSTRSIGRVHSVGSLNISASQPALMMGGETGGERTTSSEQFWVPDEILMKKRAQSLMPQLLIPHQAHTRGDVSPSNNMSSSIEDISPDTLGDNMSLMTAPMPGRTRRRTSMQDALDFTKINAELYEKEKEVSLDDVAGRFGSIHEEENHGSISISLSYSPEQGLLTVGLIQACDLVPCDYSSTADPYCRLCLLPYNKPQLQSKVHKKTLSPEFSEEFIFDVPTQQLAGLTLEILVYDFDHFSRDECIGQVHLPLLSIDFTEKVTLWKGISVYNKKQLKHDDLGDLMFSLSYLTSAERLTVVVLKARNFHFLEESKQTATANPFVKVTLSCPGGKKPKKKKTSTIRNSASPMWNEALVFNLSRGVLADAVVELTVVNDNLFGANEPIGRVVIGSNTVNEELGHWNDMVNSKTAIARWHHLTGIEADT